MWVYLLFSDYILAIPIATTSRKERMNVVMVNSIISFIHTHTDTTTTTNDDHVDQYRYNHSLAILSRYHHISLLHHHTSAYLLLSTSIPIPLNTTHSLFSSTATTHTCMHVHLIDWLMDMIGYEFTSNQTILIHQLSTTLTHSISRYHKPMLNHQHQTFHTILFTSTTTNTNRYIIE